MQVEEFFDLFGSYNETYLIVIILTYVLAIVAMLMVFKKSEYSNRIISLTLTFLWLWIGIVFGILVFGPTPMFIAGTEYAGIWYLFGSIFAIHGIILLYFGVLKDTASFTWKPSYRHYTGIIIILFGLVVYPFVGALTGRVYPEYPVFGIAPCPVTLFTLGLLLLSDKKPSIQLMFVPLFWSFMGIFPVLYYGVYADIGTILAGIVALLYYVKWPAE